MHRLLYVLCCVLTAAITGCSSAPTVVKPPVEPPVRIKPPKVKPTPVPTLPPPPPQVKPTPPAPSPNGLSEQGIHRLLLKLLPPISSDREGWATDLQQAFKSLELPPSAENFCAVIAVVEQESNFQVDPVVPNMPQIVEREIATRREKYSIPQSVVEWMLARTSRDGHSYQQRIHTLKTERELSELVDEVVDRVPGGKKLFQNYNPVRTGGAMQVSVAFAEEHVKTRPYPYPMRDGVRNEVFTRRGGLYFGSAILLDYPAPYSDPLYRFADFNAGRYSSRNAAFQHALGRISGKSIGTDGDLLRYKNGQPDSEPSTTLSILLNLKNRLGMSEASIHRDVLLEKSPSFSKTQLYGRVFELADQGGTQPRTLMPEIDLKSPKFKRKLTTEWFATRVNRRYKTCLQRASDKKPNNH